MNLSPSFIRVLADLFVGSLLVSLFLLAHLLYLLAKSLFYSGSSLDTIVMNKMQLGGVPYREGWAELSPDEPGRVFEGRKRGLHFFFRSTHADKYLGVSEVGAELGLGDGHQSDSRIFQFTCDYQTDFFLDLFG